MGSLILTYLRLWLAPHLFETLWEFWRTQKGRFPGAKIGGGLAKGRKLGGTSKGGEIGGIGSPCEWLIGYLGTTGVISTLVFNFWGPTGTPFQVKGLLPKFRGGQGFNNSLGNGGKFRVGPWFERWVHLLFSGVPAPNLGPSPISGEKVLRKGLSQQTTTPYKGGELPFKKGASS